MNSSEEESLKKSSPYYSMENDYLMKTMKDNKIKSIETDKMPLIEKQKSLKDYIELANIENDLEL